MTLRVFNTWTRMVEDFAPIDPANVRVYACGPTVYGRIHAGNARMTVVFDVLFRMLRHVYGEQAVTYVSNITDIDDKIIAEAGRNLEAISDLTCRMADHYDSDRAALGCLRPTAEPKATDYVTHMIGMIEHLVETGHAYAAEGHVLFAVATSPEYGRLSGHGREDQIAGARVEVAPYKRDPADFVLWKPSPENYPGWISPWGFGRPGWHIECSAMSADLLGQEFDIHGGGIDLTFPHHENEIAQSRCAHGIVPARYWMHNGHVMVGGQKMSKSLGNFTTVEDLRHRWPVEVIRLALLSAHYRQPLDITDDLLVSMKARLDYLYGVIRRQQPMAGPGRVPPKILEALEADLNTPSALAALQELAGAVEQGHSPAGDLIAAGRLLGFLQQNPDDWFRWQPENSDGIAEREIDALIEARRQARDRRDFGEADRVRAQLLENGVVVEDTPGGTIWKRVRL